MVSVAEAAIKFGVSQDTIRLWMTELGLEESESGPIENVETSTTDNSALSKGEVHGWESLVATLQAQVVSQQEQLEIKDRQIGELHVLLQQAQSALPAPVGNRRSSPWWRLGRK